MVISVDSNCVNTIPSHVTAAEQWTNYARRHLKAELSSASVTYEELAGRLNAIGLPESKGSIAMKVSRGSYPAAFLFAVMKALNIDAVRLEDRLEPPA